MSTASRYVVIAIFAIGLGYGTKPVHAQVIEPIALSGNESAQWNRGVAMETRQAAREMFLEGNRLFRIPLFARAAEKYREALAKWEHPAFYFNLALAELNLGEDLSAHKALEIAIRDGEGLLGAPQIQEARKQLQDLERRLGRIRIQCALDGAEVTMDGQMLFSGPGSYEAWAEPKAHEITAKKAEYLPETRRVTAVAGKVRDLELTLITLEEAGDSGRRWAKWKPWSVVAAGAAVAATSGALHAWSAHSFQRYDTAFLRLPCSSSGCSKAQIGSTLNSQLNRATLEQKIAVGGYVAGGTMLAAGIALVYLNRPRLVEPQSPGVATNAMVVMPAVSDGMVGILFTAYR